jgi:NADH-quinone oxidoreductase subunit J
MILIANLYNVLILLSALAVISVKNAVHSVLFLVLVFINASGILFLWESEFLAIVILVVYVGAVAVLFLFVCMMLEIRSSNDRAPEISYYPLSGVIGISLLLEFSTLVYSNYLKSPTRKNYENWSLLVDSQQNIVTLGSYLFTILSKDLILGGLVLLVAMIGSIHLTDSHRPDNKKQNIPEQIASRQTIVKVRTSLL